MECDQIIMPYNNIGYFLESPMQAKRIFETCLCGREIPAIRRFYTEVWDWKRWAI